MHTVLQTTQVAALLLRSLPRQGDTRLQENGKQLSMGKGIVVLLLGTRESGKIFEQRRGVGMGQLGQL